MPTDPLLLILGAGGHGRVVADAALRQGTWAQVRATDRDASRCQGSLLEGVALVDLRPHLDDASHVHIAIGAASARRAEAQAVGVARLASVIHASASVSPAARLGPGVFVAAQAVVAPLAQLGACVIVNHAAVVDHDCVLGDFCHIAPQAALGGAVRVGEGVLVGSGARVLPGVRVCAGAVLGAGTVVCADITESGIYVGVPARRVR